MYIEKVAIKNFKAIDDIEIEFRPGVNLLIGDNGVGKTSILEAITVGLGGFLTGISGVPSKNIQPDDVRIQLTEMGHASSGIQYKTPVEITSYVDIDGNKFEWTRRRKDQMPNSKTTIDNKQIAKYAQEIANDFSAQLPLLCFQSEARVWQTRRSDFGTELKKKLNDRRCGYIGCLDYSLDIKGIKEWCLKMELIAFQKGMKIAEYEIFKEIVAAVMQKMSDLPEKPVISYSQQIGDIVYNEAGESMPISLLSAGYQSLLWMTMNLAYRMALLNPVAGKNMTHIPGVVLIDELDMHLHPKWQWNVIKALEETFPNIQFIVATHSPIIISSCKNENLILIKENQKIRYLPNAYGYSVEDVLELRQESTAKPKEIETLRDRFDRALNRSDYETAKEVVEKLCGILGEEHSEVKNAKEELDLNHWAEEN